MLFLQKGDYESVMTILDHSGAMAEDERIFMQALLASDPKSPYFSAETVRIYSDTLRNLFPESSYNAQVGILSSLMNEYEGSKAQVDALAAQVAEMGGIMEEQLDESERNQETLDEYLRINSELNRQNMRLTVEERRLKRELDDMRLRMEALKEIDMQLKRNTDGQKIE